METQTALLNRISVLENKLNEIDKMLDIEQAKNKEYESKISMLYLTSKSTLIDSRVMKPTIQDKYLHDRLQFIATTEVPGAKTYNKILQEAFKYDEEEKDCIDKTAAIMIKSLGKRPNKEIYNKLKEVDLADNVESKHYQHALDLILKDKADEQKLQETTKAHGIEH